MKGIRIFRRNIISATKSISRNWSLSFASIICTTITLVIVALAMVVSYNVNEFTKDLENTLSIIVFVDRGATDEEITTIKSKMLAIKNIKSDEIIYKDKETLRQEIIKNSEENSQMYSIMNSINAETNFLKPEFILTVKDVSELQETAKTLKSIEHVSNVEYNESVAKKMIPTFKVVEKVTIIIILGLVVVSIFLICNTIRITIFARKNEIEIMRLVGTSNFVIKLPFVIEGLFLGIIGSIVPVVGTIWGYTLAYDKLEGHLFTNLITMAKPLPFTIYVSVIIVAIGGLVGMLGSYGTVRRHLKI